MRLFLLASFTSMHADAAAYALRARGYGVVSYYDVHMPGYATNAGRVPSDQEARRNMGCELLENALCVVHPDTDLDLLQEVQAVCRALRMPMVRYADVPLTPTDSTEWVDACNGVHEDALALLGIDKADIHDRLHYAVKHELIGTPSDLHLGKTYELDPRTPSRLEAILAEDDRRYSADAILNNMRNSIAGSLRRMLAWSDRHLAGLKNPMVAQVQRGRADYLERTAPLSTTG